MVLWYKLKACFCGEDKENIMLDAVHPKGKSRRKLAEVSDFLKLVRNVQKLWGSS